MSVCPYVRTSAQLILACSAHSQRLSELELKMGKMNIDLVYLRTPFLEHFLLHRVWSHKLTHAIYYKITDNYQNSSWLLGHIPHLYLNIFLTLWHTKPIGWTLTKTLSTASASKMLNSRNLSKPTWSLQALNQFLHKVTPAPGATWATRPTNGGRVISQIEVNTILVISQIEVNTILVALLHLPIFQPIMSWHPGHDRAARRWIFPSDRSLTSPYSLYNPSRALHIIFLVWIYTRFEYLQ